MAHFYEASSFLQDLDILLKILKQGNRTLLEDVLEQKCEPRMDDQMYFQLCLIPAFLILISFSLTQRRRNVMVDCFRGRPGFVYPMDMLTRSNRLSYACAFGATVYLVYKVVFENFYAFDYEGPAYLHTLAAIASMLVYGMVYFPVFACLSIGSVYGYGLGALYVWMMTVVEILRLFDCDEELETRVAIVLKRLPQVLCLLYLSSCIPGRFIQSVRRKEFFVQAMEEFQRHDSEDLVAQAYYGVHVRSLFKTLKAARVPSSRLHWVKQNLCQLFNQRVYRSRPGFRYSSRMLTTMVVGAVVLYQVVFECVVYSNTFFEAVLLILENDLELVGEVRKVTDSELVKKTRDVLRISIIVFKVVRVVLLVSLGLAALLGVVSIISAFPSYRRNLLALHRGNYSKLADRSERSNSELLAGSMRFAGYQVGYIAWGFIIQTAIFFIFFLLIATVIVLFIFDISSWAVDMLYTLWPVPALALAVNFSQVVFAKLFFLDSFGESLALTNRRIFFIFTYFLFFYNIFMGVFSCLLRIGKSLVLGAYLLPRLDHGILPRTFQFMDPGFHAYIGFLHVENAHCHPVVLTFVRLLLMACPKHGRRKLRDGDIYDESGYSVQMVNFRGASDNSGGEAVKKRVMYRWHLLYTLLQNPQVRLMRKGYLQSLMRARDLGLHIPVSDQTLASDAADIRERTLSYLQGVPGPQSGDIDSCEDIDCHEGIRERTLNYLQVGVPGPQREDIDKEDIKSHQLVVSGAEITTDDRQAEDVGYGSSTVGNGSGDSGNGGGSGGDVVRVCGDNNGDVVVIDRDVCDNRGDREGGHDSRREGEGAIQRVLSSHSVGPSTRNSDPWLDGPP